MTGWFLFTGIVCLLVGAGAGFAAGIYLSANNVAKMINRGELTPTEKWETK